MAGLAGSSNASVMAGSNASVAEFYGGVVGVDASARWAPPIPVNTATQAPASVNEAKQPKSSSAVISTGDDYSQPAGPALAPPTVRVRAPAFRSTGLHQLGAWKAEVIPAKAAVAASAAAHSTQGAHARASSAPPTTAAPPSRPASGRDEGPRHSRVNYGISAENVGFLLLKKAGWHEGGGVGAEGQGRVEPVQAHFNKGMRGIGFDSSAAQRAAQAKQAAQAATAAEERRAAAAATAARGAERRARIDAIVEAELAGEDVESKVKRYKQVERQEADDAKHKAIASYLRKAFNEPDLGISADVNPLGRSRLTSSNPLLDPFEFD